MKINLSLKLLSETVELTADFDVVFNTSPGVSFVCLFLAVLGLHCCTQAFPSCGERRLLSSFGAQASHCGGLLLLWNTGSRLLRLP